MYTQLNKRFLPIINEIGCFFISCVNMTELITSSTLSIEDINKLWQYCKDKKIIDDNNCLMSSQKLINRCLAMLNSDIRVLEVATKKNGKTSYYSFAKSSLLSTQRYYIQKILTVNGNTHFRLVDSNDLIIFDSYTPIPKTDKVLYTIVYSIVNARG